jgi:hypothetical protein
VRDLARRTLVELVAEHGADLARDARRLRGLLKDNCPAARKEITALVGAAEEGIPEALQSYGAGVPAAVHARRLTERLENSLGVTEDLAEWAVESWRQAVAPDMASTADVTRPLREDHTALRGSSVPVMTVLPPPRVSGAPVQVGESRGASRFLTVLLALLCLAAGVALGVFCAERLMGESSLAKETTSSSGSSSSTSGELVSIAAVSGATIPEVSTTTVTMPTTTTAASTTTTTTRATTTTVRATTTTVSTTTTTKPATFKVTVELWSVDDNAALYLNGSVVATASWGYGAGGVDIGEVPGGAGPLDVSAWARRGTNTVRFVIENEYPSGAGGFYSLRLNGKEVYSDGFRGDSVALGTAFDRTHTFNLP